jgi:hypothetical protein
LFITLQHYVDAMSIENAVDIMGETVATGMQTEEFNTPSAFSICEAEPRVSLVTEEFCCVCFCRCL